MFELWLLSYDFKAFLHNVPRFMKCVVLHVFVKKQF